MPTFRHLVNEHQCGLMNKNIVALLSIFFLFVILGLSSIDEKRTSTDENSFSKTIVSAFPFRSFAEPLYLTHAGDGSNRIFVLEKSGKAKVFPNDPSTNDVTVFFDLSSQLLSPSDADYGETGLMSMAFHPDYANNGKLYISYVNSSLMSVVSEILVSSNPDSADLSTERKLLELQQPQRNHNGGHISFGDDGYLYIAFGDGFSESARDGISHGDPHGHGQNPATWFSSVLRIDIDQQQDNLAYGIPTDNPFVGNQDGWKEEVYAYGFRNPWRFSFDRANGQLWLADVGDKKAEEINIVESGDNCGWNLKESFYCFEDLPCDTTQWASLSDPVFEYLRNVGESITGGYVYRGSDHPDLFGKYIYGDYDFKNIWALDYDGSSVVSNEQLSSNAGRIASFGEDESGEIYIVDLAGKIWTFQVTTNTSNETDFPTKSGLIELQSYPNPFTDETRISFELSKSVSARIVIYNQLGQEIRSYPEQIYQIGSHEKLWTGKTDDGSEVKSGLYFYSIESADFKKSGSIQYLK